MTLTNVNLVFSIFGHNQPDVFIIVAIFIVFSILGHIQTDMFVVVAIFILNFGQVNQVNIRRCQFSVMFTDFCHIHSVMLTTLVSYFNSRTLNQ